MTAVAEAATVTAVAEAATAATAVATADAAVGARGSAVAQAVAAMRSSCRGSALPELPERQVAGLTSWRGRPQTVLRENSNTNLFLFVSKTPFFFRQ